MFISQIFVNFNLWRASSPTPTLSFFALGLFPCRTHPIMAAATLTPNFKWGQDKKHLFVTIEVADCKNAVVEIKETGIVFSYVCPSHSRIYARTFLAHVAAV
jgi:hypothetical protein